MKVNAIKLNVVGMQKVILNVNINDIGYDDIYL